MIYYIEHPFVCQSIVTVAKALTKCIYFSSHKTAV